MVFILIQLKNDKTTCQMNKEAHASVEIGQSIYHLHSLSECWSVLFSLYPLFCWSQVVCHLHSLSCQNIAVYCFSCIHVLSSFGEYVFLVLFSNVREDRGGEQRTINKNRPFCDWFHEICAKMTTLTNMPVQAACGPVLAYISFLGVCGLDREALFFLFFFTNRP